MKRVLVVDDDAVNRKLATILFKKRGWQVAEAKDGVSALALLADSPFDYVLLDISMPGLDGREVCQRIRHSGYPHILRIVAYTAHAIESEKASIMAAGFDDILIKPVTMDRLNSMFPD